MSKFRYYITDLFDGCAKGTNSEQIAQEYAVCQDCFVVDSETGEWLTSEGRVEIKEVGKPS